LFEELEKVRKIKTQAGPRVALLGLRDDGVWLDSTG
jgi:hypothetical protein